MKRLAIAGALIFVVGHAFAEQTKPSFDCAKAKSNSERAICSDEELARLDRELAAIYQSALKAGTVDKRSQFAWIRRRDAECIGKLRSCLQTRMQERIAELRRGASRNEQPLGEQPKPAAMDQAALSRPLTVSRLLRPAGTAVQFHPNRWAVFDHHLLFDEFDASGNAKHIVSFNPTTGRSTVVAANLHEPIVLLSDPRVTVVVEPQLEDGIEIVVSDSATGQEWRRFKIGRVPDTATVIDQELRLASTSKEFPPRLAIDILDLATNSPKASREIWHVPDYGRPVFWKDKIVLVSPAR